MVEMAVKSNMNRRQVLRSAAKKAAVVAGTFALGAGTAVVMHKVVKARRAKYLAERKALGALIGSKLPSLKRQSKWVDICQACKWTPEKLPVKKIQLIANASTKTKISVERIAFTISVNPALNLASWQTRLRGKQKQLQQAIADSKKRGLPGRHAKERATTFREQIAQAQRVIRVMEALLSENPGLARELGRELASAGIKANLKALAEK